MRESVEAKIALGVKIAEFGEAMLVLAEKAAKDKSFRYAHAYLELARDATLISPKDASGPRPPTEREE